MNFSSQKIKYIDTAEIRPNPYQCRRNFDMRTLENLADSMKKVGVLSPVILRTTSDGYEIVCGNRRHRAALMAGFKKIPAIIIRAGDKQCAQLNLIENIHRDNLTVFEEAESYYNLLCYHKMKKDVIKEELSSEAGEILAKTKLLSITPSVRYKIERNGIGKTVAEEIIKIHDKEKQEEITDLIIKEKLSEEDVKSLVKQLNNEMAKNKRKTSRTNLPLCKNTIKKTVNILKENGQKVDFEQKESENYIEFILKLRKTGVF